VERPVEREDLHAAIEARKELGADLEPQIIDSFVERIERRLDERRQTKPAHRYGEPGRAFALAIVSLVMAIPISAIAAEKAGITGLLIAWIGIVLVNLFYSGRR
jgi:hypothetical protein